MATDPDPFDDLSEDDIKGNPSSGDPFLDIPEDEIKIPATPAPAAPVAPAAKRGVVDWLKSKLPARPPRPPRPVAPPAAPAPEVKLNDEQKEHLEELKNRLGTEFSKEYLEKLFEEYYKTPENRMSWIKRVEKATKWWKRSWLARLGAGIVMGGVGAAIPGLTVPVLAVRSGMVIAGTTISTEATLDAMITARHLRKKGETINAYKEAGKVFMDKLTSEKGIKKTYKNIGPAIMESKKTLVEKGHITSIEELTQDLAGLPDDKARFKEVERRLLGVAEIAKRRGIGFKDIAGQKYIEEDKKTVNILLTKYQELHAIVQKEELENLYIQLSSDKETLDDTEKNKLKNEVFAAFSTSQQNRFKRLSKDIAFKEDLIGVSKWLGSFAFGTILAAYSFWHGDAKAMYKAIYNGMYKGIKNTIIGWAGGHVDSAHATAGVTPAAITGTPGTPTPEPHAPTPPPTPGVAPSPEATHENYYQGSSIYGDKLRITEAADGTKYVEIYGKNYEMVGNDSIKVPSDSIDHNGMPDLDAKDNQIMTVVKIENGLSGDGHLQAHQFDKIVSDPSKVDWKAHYKEGLLARGQMFDVDKDGSYDGQLYLDNKGDIQATDGIHMDSFNKVPNQLPNYLSKINPTNLTGDAKKLFGDTYTFTHFEGHDPYYIGGMGTVDADAQAHDIAKQYESLVKHGHATQEEIEKFADAIRDKMTPNSGFGIDDSDGSYDVTYDKLSELYKQTFPEENVVEKAASKAGEAIKKPPVPEPSNTPSPAPSPEAHAIDPKLTEVLAKDTGVTYTPQAQEFIQKEFGTNPINFIGDAKDKIVKAFIKVCQTNSLEITDEINKLINNKDHLAIIQKEDKLYFIDTSIDKIKDYNIKDSLGVMELAKDMPGEVLKAAGLK